MGFHRSLRELGSQHRLHGKLCASFGTHREPSSSALSYPAPHGWWGWIHPARLALGTTGAQKRGDVSSKRMAQLESLRAGGAHREGALPGKGGQAGFCLGGQGSPGVRSPLQRGAEAARHGGAGGEKGEQEGKVGQKPLSCLAAGVRGQGSGGPGVERVSRLLPPSLPSSWVPRKGSTASSWLLPFTHRLAGDLLSSSSSQTRLPITPHSFFPPCLHSACIHACAYP